MTDNGIGLKGGFPRVNIFFLPFVEEEGFL